MTRSRMIWPGGLLALGLAVGCRHTQPQAQPDDCPACAAAAAAGTAAPQLSLVPTNPPLVANAPPPLVPQSPIVVAPTRPAPLALTPPQSAPLPATPRSLPAVTAAPVAPAPPTVNPEQSAPPAKPWVMPQAKSAPLPTVRTPAAPAPTPVVTSTPVPAAPGAAAAPQYFNSPDYSILFGVLDYNARHGTWRLRYADAGEEDRYGGSVTLDGVGRQMQGYSSGQFVRVEGGLVDPESREISPAYRVRELRPVSQGQ
jgi:hypothetical protein